MSLLYYCTVLQTHFNKLINIKTLVELKENVKTETGHFVRDRWLRTRIYYTASE
jgi:hypothetical protein